MGVGVGVGVGAIAAGGGSGVTGGAGGWAGVHASKSDNQAAGRGFMVVAGYQGGRPLAVIG